MANTPKPSFKDGGKVIVYHVQPPATDRPAAGVVQPGFKPGPDNMYHGTQTSPAEMPKGGGPGTTPIALGYTSSQPQETE